MPRSLPRSSTTGRPPSDRRPAVAGGRRFILIFVLLLLAMASAPLALAQEATGPALTQLQVDLWPQYDDPRLLVIYRGSLASLTDDALRFPIPSDAEVNAVAYLSEDDRLISLDWTAEPAGAEKTITFTPQTTRFQLEYYIDVIGPGPERSFTVTIDADGQPVDVLGIGVQQPAGASDLQGEPALSGPVVGFQGLSYYSREVEDVQPGQAVSQAVTYTKPGDTLTAEQVAPAAPTQPPAPAESEFSTNLAGRSTARFWLPVGATVIVVLGLVLVGVGAWRSRQRAPAPAPTTRRSRASRRRPERPAEEEPAKFCHRCGAVFEPGDRFCAECGAQRRGM